VVDVLLVGAGGELPANPRHAALLARRLLEETRLACPRPIDSNCVTWSRASFTPSARRSVSRGVSFRSDQVRTTHPRPGQRHLLTAPAPSRAIRGVLGKFADLPQEAEDEIRTFDAARRRIAELDRQIKHLKGVSGARQLDQITVERAAKSAVERERVAWQRKWEQGRARFRQLAAGLVLTGQSLTIIKELLEETERGWLAP
jgi:hypothetical protein